MNESDNTINNLSSSNDEVTNDFVAIDSKRNRICISGREDNFMAIKVDDTWKEGYPEFDDLMDNYSELKNNLEVRQFSLDARNSLNTEKI